MAPIRFMLVSTHTEQITGYSKVSYNLLKQLSTLHPLVKVFHFGFQKAQVNLQTPSRPVSNVIQYDAAANENPRQQGFGFNVFKDYVETVNPDIIMIYNDPIVVTRFLDAIKDVEKTFKVWVYLDQVYTGVDMGLLRNIENRSDRIICFTESWKAHLKTRLTTSDVKIDVLEHGVDSLVFKRLPDSERLVARKSLSIPADAKVFLNMNRNTQRKRLDLTIMGFARLLKKNPDSNLYLIMVTSVRPETGAYYNPLQIFMSEVERLGLDMAGNMQRLICVDTSQPTAYFGDAAINQIYNAADVGVNTANGEGFGLCQLEHLATGSPQVVIDIGGYRAFLNDDVAVLVPPTIYSYIQQGSGIGLVDSTATAEAVSEGLEKALHMCEDPLVVQKCQQTASQRPWSRICDDFLESVVSFKNA